MWRARRVIPVLLAAVVAGCESDPPTACCTPLDGTGPLRVVNAFVAPVDVVIDGSIVHSALPAGAVVHVAAPAGGHTLAFRANGSTVTSSRSITTADNATVTIAAVRNASGSLSSAALDDTNSVVPPGATKVRVLHLAPAAGTLQVYRTQPDFQTPIAWQFPFNYQPDPTALSAPFYQSTVGTWEVRIWQSPAGASGWATAPVRVVIPLTSGQKRTVLILDQPGGGVRVELL
jgi:hypothetical protein